MTRRQAMRKGMLLAIAAAMGVVLSSANAGRFGEGGGGGRGGAQPKGNSAPVSRPQAGVKTSQSAAVHGPHGGSAAASKQSAARTTPGGGTASASRQAATATGARGGQAAAGSRSASGTTGGGSTYNSAAHGEAYAGPGGTKAVGGSKSGTVTTPGGKTVGGSKSGAVVVGPAGNVHAASSKNAAVVSPSGSAVAGSHTTAAATQRGTAATTNRAAVASGPGGAAAASSKTAVAVGPHGAAASTTRSAAAVGTSGRAVAGTRYTSHAELQGQGTAVRASYRNYQSFTPSWYSKNPGAWAAAGYVAGSAWSPATWTAASSFAGFPATATATYYDYGDGVTYQEGSVYYGTQLIATEAEYADQAVQLAEAGRQAKPADDNKWQPLGVFAIIQGDETTSDNIFQLALNTDGIVRGNYYNAAADTTQPVLGSLDKKTQRIAWTVGDKKDTVYETGLYNLTLEETAILVHFGKDQTEQHKLFRVEQPQEEKK